MLRGRLGVAVPEWRADTVVDGQLVVGYPALPGHPAAYEPEGSCDFRYVIPIPPPRAYSREMLARVLARLHSIDVTMAAGRLGIAIPTVTAIRDGHATVLRRCAATFPGKLGALAPMEVQLADEGLWDFTPTVRHGDVHPEHTLIDGEAG